MSSGDKKDYSFVSGNFAGNSDGLHYVTQLNTGNGVNDDLIANHIPEVSRYLQILDGFTVTEQIELQAYRNGKYETPVRTDKRAIRGTTPDVIFSPACYIYPGKGHVSLYSLFIMQQCERENKIEKLYTHTGYFETEDDGLVYLNGENSICKNGLTPKYAVQLPDGLSNYRFWETGCNSHDSFKTVWDGMKRTTVDNVYVPLYAYAFLTPLNYMLRKRGKEPRFSLYIVGKTGTFKTSIAKVILCFWGQFNYGTSAPASFRDTPNSIEKILGVGADVPILIDDKRPGGTYKERIHYAENEKSVSEFVGDRAAKARLNADGSSRKRFIPRANVIVTGEEAYVDLTPSAIARALTIELEPGSIDFTGLNYLQEHPEHFNKVMQLYIQFVIQHYDNIEKKSDDLLKQYRELANSKGHTRLATNFSELMLGYSIFLAFLVDYRHISEGEMNTLLVRAQDIFLDMCKKQDNLIRQETPTDLFISLLKEMLETKRVQLADLRTDRTSGTVSLSTTERRIGYRDDDYIYLIPQDTYNEVYKYYGESGNVFHASKTSLWKMLMDEGKILPKMDKDGNFVRVDKPKMINGKSSKYIWLLASVLDNDDMEEGENNE